MFAAGADRRDTCDGDFSHDLKEKIDLTLFPQINFFKKTLCNFQKKNQKLWTLVAAKRLFELKINFFINYSVKN